MGAMRLYRMRAVGDPGRQRVLTPGTAVVLRRAYRGDPGLFDFLKSAGGIIANTQIIGWLDLPWYLTPVTNIATGQLAQLMRPICGQNAYQWPVDGNGSPLDDAT